ncbi:MAG TPA: hypothetical protein ACFYEK_15615, partial [Candidatus Wunengus sp. YC60]|uniref:hypothetical protein n=1 Tax=Candidatus Wunengus sp. YC60 TaxID=3367697 RepID=UPI00402A0846
MKRPKTSSKKTSWFNIASVFLLAVTLAMGVTTSAQAATGSFDRDAYLPPLSDTNDYDRAFITVTDSSVTTATTDTITVSIKAGSNVIDFVLKETGATTTVFTTTGNTQPSQTGVGTTTGYVADYSGSHLYPALGTAIYGVNLQSFASQSGGNAETPSNGVLNVSSGNTLMLLYNGSTLDTATIGFNGDNNSSITFTKGSTWGDSVSGSADSASANLIISINDPDQNLNPKMKDVIGFQDGFALGLTGTGSSRVQIETIDQSTGSTYQISSTDVITRNIMLVESGQSTGIFTAQGKVYGSTTATKTGNVTVGSTAGYSG